MHALLNPVKVAQPVQNRPDPVVLQIRLNVILEILALFDVDLFYSRVNLRESSIIIPLWSLLDQILQVMI